MAPEQRGLGVRRRGRALLKERSARPALAASHVAELVGELAPLLRDARVQDVVGLPPRDLLLVLAPDPARVPGRDVLRLRLSADPTAPRLHLQHGRVRRHEGPLGPFFRRVADELIGARLASLEALGGERAAVLELRETPSGEHRSLIAELFGRGANLVLCGRDGRVLELVVPPSPGKAGEPPRLALGAAWQRPRGATPQAAPPLVEALALPADAGEAPTLAPLSWRVEQVLGGAASEERSSSLRAELLARVRRKLERVRGLVVGLERRARAAEGAERVRLDGELVKLHLGALRRGQAELVCADVFGDGAERRVALDAKLAPRENMERLFAKAKKLERAQAAVGGELALAREKQARLEALLAEAQASEEPEALDARAVAEGLLDARQEPDLRKRKAPAPRLPYRVFHTRRGGEVRVGRNARDNDELTLRHARGSDLWLHTADAPGSHVVLRVEKGAEPDAEDQLDAAHLALWFSPLRGARRARIHVARRKEVHKPRGAKPGLVTLSGGRVLELRVEQERLERLLRARPGAEGEEA